MMYYLLIRINSERLFSMVERLQELLLSKLGNDGYDKTVRAVNVYKRILEVLEEARETATTALEKAIDARQKVFFCRDTACAK